jgi:hypothetical protein
MVNADRRWIVVEPAATFARGIRAATSACQTAIDLIGLTPGLTEV